MVLAAGCMKNIVSHLSGLVTGWSRMFDCRSILFLSVGAKPSPKKICETLHVSSVYTYPWIAGSPSGRSMRRRCVNIFSCKKETTLLYPPVSVSTGAKIQKRCGSSLTLVLHGVLQVVFRQLAASNVNLPKKRVWWRDRRGQKKKKKLSPPTSLSPPFSLSPPTHTQPV